MKLSRLEVGKKPKFRMDEERDYLEIKVGKSGRKSYYNINGITGKKRSISFKTAVKKYGIMRGTF